MECERKGMDGEGRGKIEVGEEGRRKGEDHSVSEVR